MRRSHRRLLQSHSFVPFQHAFLSKKHSNIDKGIKGYRIRPTIFTPALVAIIQDIDKEYITIFSFITDDIFSLFC